MGMDNLYTMQAPIHNLERRSDIPSSWEYGAFHITSRYFSSYLNSMNSGGERHREMEGIDPKERMGREDIMQRMQEERCYTKYEREEELRKTSNMQLSEQKLYMIDKVARRRVKTRPYGAEYSEFMNLKLEDLSKENEENVSRLSNPQVRGTSKEKEDSLEQRPGGKGAATTDNSKEFNQRFIQRLDIVSNQRHSSNQQLNEGASRQPMSFDEWIRLKNSEDRFRRQLVQIEKEEARKQLTIRDMEKKQDDERRYMVYGIYGIYSIYNI